MIIRQYQSATNLLELLYGVHNNNSEDFPGILDYLTISVEQFLNDYFDIDTCDTDGLDNWGRILNFNRNIFVADDNNTIGFEGAQENPLSGDIDIVYPQNLYNANFHGGATKPAIVNDEQYRLLLKFRYKILNTNGSIASINYVMNSYFQQQNKNYHVIVQESSIMSIIFRFNFMVKDFEFYTFNKRENMPIPMGVNYSLLYNQIF